MTSTPDSFLNLYILKVSKNSGGPVEGTILQSTQNTNKCQHHLWIALNSDSFWGPLLQQSVAESRKSQPQQLIHLVIIVIDRLRVGRCFIWLLFVARASCWLHGWCCVADFNTQLSLVQKIPISWLLMQTKWIPVELCIVLDPAVSFEDFSDSGNVIKFWSCLIQTDQVCISCRTYF